LNCLLQNKYKRSNELQRIFNRAISDNEYKIWLHFYITNNNHNSDADSLFQKFNYNNTDFKAYVGAKCYYLNDIYELFYGKRFKENINFNFNLPTVNKGTELSVLPQEYGLDGMIKAHYLMTPVIELYKMYKEAIGKGYEIFEENIREYLGTEGINNGIIRTLKSKSDRENFFYYNNGVTII